MDETATRPIAEVVDYDTLILAMRLRADQLNVSRETIDEIAGLCDRYAAKLLSRQPVKRLGLGTLGPVLSALGMKLIAVPDPDALERYRDRRVERNATRVRENPGQPLAIADTADAPIAFASCTDGRAPHEGQAHAG